MMDDFERDLATVLRSAVPAPPAEIDPAELIRSAPRGRARTLAAPLVTALVVAAVVVTVLALAHTGGGHPRPAASAPAPAPVASGSHGPNHPLDVKIELDRTTVQAGDPINGEAIVTNATAHPLVIADCHGEWIQVGLTNATVPYAPVWAGCLSLPGTTLPVGTTRIPISVRSTYNACTQHAGSATADMPACLHGRDGAIMPPLPPGSYTTRTVMIEPKGVPVPTPNAIHVTLTS
jgi:hypothetical protein